MPRLSIDLTPQEHQQIKAIAALNGQSLKQFVLERTIGGAPEVSDDAKQAYKELAEFLAPSIANIRAGNVIVKSAEDIKRSAREKLKQRDG